MTEELQKKVERAIRLIRSAGSDGEGVMTITKTKTKVNNIIYYNAVKKLDRMIAEKMEETKSVVKDGYPCLQQGCYLARRNRCGLNGTRWKKECNWDLMSSFWEEIGNG